MQPRRQSFCPQENYGLIRKTDGYILESMIVLWGKYRVLIIEIPNHS